MSFFWALRSLQMVATAMKLENSCFLAWKLWQIRQCVKKQRHHFANKSPHSQGYSHSSSHVELWELDHMESRAPKSWCFQTVVLEETLENPLDSKGLVNPKGNQPWIFIRRTDAEAAILWPPDGKRHWCWETLRAEEGGKRGWDGWMASLTQWTWVWANSRR